MALHELNFTFKAQQPISRKINFAHYGVVGSGDLEILFENLLGDNPLDDSQLDNNVQVTVVTPVSGFDHVWQLVLDKFIQDSGLCNIKIKINDNNATPAVVALRLQQILLEIEGDNNDNE